MEVPFDSRSKAGRLISACGLLCLLSAPLARCGGGVITPPPEPVTIRFAFLSDLAESEYYDPLVKEFNEIYPHITVELYSRSLSGLFGEESGPFDADVFLGPDWFPYWLREVGAGVNLDALVARDGLFDLDGFYPSAVDYLTDEGEIWAIPAGIDVVMMFYNRDLFDRYGVSPPEIGWTWDDFLGRAAGVTDVDAGVFGYGAGNPADVPLEFPGALALDLVPFIYQHGGRIADDLQNPTRMTFNDPLTVEAVAWYTDLIVEHNVAPTPEQARRAFEGGSSYESNVMVGISMGQIGMWQWPLTRRGGANYVPWNYDWGVVPLPGDAQLATRGWVYGYALSAEARHQDACWRWIVFLSEKVPPRLMPARRSIADSSEYDRLVGEDVATATRVSIANADIVPYEMLLYVDPDFRVDISTFEMAVQSIIRGANSPQEAMDWAQRQVER